MNWEIFISEARWQAAVQSLVEAQQILRQRTGERGQATLIVGASSPQAQSVSYYLAASLAGVGRYAEAAPLLQDLLPADLAGAEPRDDWAARLDAMRGEVLLGPGQKANAIALLAPAVSCLSNGQITLAAASRPTTRLPTRRTVGPCSRECIGAEARSFLPTPLMKAKGCAPPAIHR